MVQELNPDKLRRVVATTTINWKQIREKHLSKPLIGQKRA